MADPNDPNDGAPPREVHVGPAENKTNWLAWLALAAGILALLFALSRCDNDNEAVVVADPPVATETVVAPVAAPAAETSFRELGVLAAYMAGTEATPQTFLFSGREFATGESEILPANRSEIDTVAGLMNQYPTSRVRVVGYADARGAAPMNAELGQARADSVKAALVADGIDAGRIETASGGETDPVATNATTGGRTANRRTELVVLQR